MHQQKLEYLGLSEKEAKVYLALLKVEKMQAIQLSRKLGIKQPTIYVILDSLLNKKVIYPVQVGKRNYFAAESPNSLRVLVDKEKMNIETKSKKAEKIIAELNTIERDSGERPVVRYYNGKTAVKNSVDEFVSMEDYSEGLDYGIYSYDLLNKIFDKKTLDDIEGKRVKNNIRFRAIYTGDDKVLTTDKANMKEVMKIDQYEFPIECDIGIFKDEVRFHILNNNEPTGILIKNREIANTLKSIIDYTFSIKKNL